MAILKFAIRRNLIYLLQNIIWSFILVFLGLLIIHLFKFSGSLLFSQIYFLGELTGGLLIYFYLKKFENKKGKEKKKYFMSIELIKNEEDYNDYFVPIDNNIKILFLIFITSFLFMVCYLIMFVHLPKFSNLSKSLSGRLSGFITIFSLFFYVYTLKLPIYNHHKFSLLMIGICLLIIIILEYYYQEVNIFLTYGDMSKAIALIIVCHLFASVGASIEKYLFEFDYMDPFIVLIYEGIFGFMLTFLWFFDRNYHYDISTVYKKNSAGMFILFVFLLFLYLIL